MEAVCLEEKIWKGALNWGENKPFEWSVGAFHNIVVSWVCTKFNTS